MAFGSLTGAVSAGFQWTAAAAAPPSSMGFTPTANQNALAARLSVLLGGNVANGANEIAFGVLAINSSASATFNTQNFTDVLGATNVAVVRVKSFLFWLLSTAQDSVSGTNASSITVGGGASNPTTLTLSANSNYSIFNGNFWENGDGSAAGVAQNATVCNIKFQNNDGANAAGVLYALAGSTT